ncbi:MULTISPECIES: hypothetical protein [Bacillus]|nr:MULTISPECIES: hypothetical protein [Bacillus cereus group]EJR04049.1 hypothetical protein II5_03756 [Bacillus cereus MSX-A1]MBV6678948.1 hypothetical protein [Bacillus thuringiensis]MCH5447006.1 hypothetical protein [Bacillus cereus]MDR4154443.1 hypothetical protein [Bacillus cereus]MEB9936248.1 hypothetical protein [Bacillus cereus]
MKLLLLVLLLAIISYIYFFRTLKKDLYFMNSIQKSTEHMDGSVDIEKYIICIEKSMIIDDFYFYKDVVKIMPKNIPYELISFDFSKEDDANFNLIDKLKLKNIPSIHFVDEQKKSKEIFNFNDLEDSLNSREVLKIIKGVLYNNESQGNLK